MLLPLELCRRASSCGHCGGDVSGQSQTCGHRYDGIDIPLLSAEITRIELHGARCGHCGKRLEAEPPDGMHPARPSAPTVMRCCSICTTTSRDMISPVADLDADRPVKAILVPRPSTQSTGQRL